MSNSIKDYKSEFDNISVSPSFMSRTEVLMREATQSVVIKPKPAITWQKITGISAALAACLLLVFAVNNRQQTIVTEDISADVTSVCETAPPVAVTEVYYEGSETAAVKVELDGSVLGDLGSDMPAVSETSVPANTKSTKPAKFTKATTAAKDNAPATEASPDIKAVVPPATSAAPAKTTAKSTEIKAKDAGAGTLKSTQRIDSGDAEYEEDDVPVKEIVIVEGSSAVITSVNGLDIIPVIPEDISAIDFTNVTSELNVFGIINDTDLSIVLSETDAAAISYAVANICAESKTMGNISFKSVFNLRIADTETDQAYFDIYLTDNQCLVITRHDLKGQQRTTYMLSTINYDRLENLMYTHFGTQSDYEAYLAYRSGK